MPEVPPADNPASRLHAILTKLLEQPGRLPLAVGWRGALGLGEDSTDGQLWRHLAAVYALPAEVLDRAQEYPDAHSAPHFMDWVEPVNSVIGGSVNLGQPTTNMANYLLPQVMTSLSFTAWLLGQDGRRMPTKAQEEELLAAIRTLEDDLLAATDLDEELRGFLMEHVRRMRDALLLVHVKGVQAFHDVAETGWGAAIFCTATKGNTPWAQRLWDVGGKAATLAQLATTGVAIAAADLPALPGIS